MGLGLINKSMAAKIAALGLVGASLVSFVAMSSANTTFSLEVTVTDQCGPVQAQVTVVNGPDDGAFGITDANGKYTFPALNSGVFYLHIAADGHIAKDTDTIVLVSDQSIDVVLDRTSECPTPEPTPTPTPVPSPVPPPAPTTYNLDVTVNDICGPIVAQITIVNGPDDGAFGITDAAGHFTFSNLNAGVFYLHVSSDNHVAKDTDAIVLDSNKSITVTLDRTNGDCNPTPTPPPPGPTPPPPAPTTYNLDVTVNDICGPIVAQITIVNGPDDGAFGMTNSNGQFTFTGLNAGVFYLHITSTNHVAKDTDAIVLDSNKSITVTLDRTNGDCNPTPPPTDHPPGGYLDQADCTAISGWAKDPDNDDKLTVKIYADGPSTSGTLIATVVADQFRSDVGNHAFSIPTPAALKNTSSHTVYAYLVSGSGLVQLTGSPKTMGPCATAPTPCTSLLTAAEFKSALDKGTILASAISVNESTNKAQATLTNNTECPTQVSLSSYEMFDPLPKLSTQKFFYGTGLVTIQSHSTGTLTVNIPTCASQIDFWYGLHPTTLLDSNPYSYPNVPFVLRYALARQNSLCGPVDHPPGGYLDQADCTAISGWAKDPDNDDKLTVKIYADGPSTSGTLIATVVADQFRSDVGNHAFSIPTPAALKDGNSHSVYAYVVSGGSLIALSNSPKTVLCPVVPPDGTVSIEKTVRNTSDGQTSFSESVNADPNDEVEFKLVVTASGGSVHNVAVTDTLPAKLAYIQNSLKVDGVIGSNNLSDINLGNMSSGQTKTVTFKAKVASASEFSTGTSTLTNVGLVNSDSNSDSDTAEVKVTINPPSDHPSISVTKTARNISDNESSFSDSVSANPSERIEFKILVSSNGQGTARDVEVVDTLPSNFKLVSGDLSNDLGDMAEGTTKTVFLTAEIDSNSSFDCGSTTRTNTARATSSNASSSEDTANVVVTRTSDCGGGGGGSSRINLTLTKEVRNLTTGGSYSSSVTAREDDRVQFRIVVENTRSRTARDVRVTDDLPSGLEYISGTFDIDQGSNSGNLFGSGTRLGDMKADTSRTITFQARVTRTGTLTNKAEAKGDNTNTARDEATVRVNIAGGNIDLNLSKKAYNETRRVDATTVTAQVGDVITYTLTVENDGNKPATEYIFQDDITDVLEFSMLQDFGEAEFQAGSTAILKWPAVTIPAHSKVQKTFSVKVYKTALAGRDNTMTNVFGNTVNVKVPTVGGIFTPPKTGTAATVSLILAMLTLGGYAVKRNKETLLTYLRKI